MKKFQLFTLSFLIVLFTFSSVDALAQKKKHRCFLSKKSKTEKVDTENQLTVVRAPGVQNPKLQDSIKAVLMKEKLMNQALVVSFISKGSGIDSKSMTQLETMIQDYSKKKNCELIYDKKKWGKEGEIDFCFISNQADCIAGFTAQLKNTFKNKPLIQIQENTACRK